MMIMMIAKSISFSIFIIIIIIIIASTHADAVTFTIRNNCPITVWAAAIPGGGRRLGLGQSWTVDIPAVITQGRIWARTGCSFDGAGRGRCRTGDCNGLLQCQVGGDPPNTVAEFALNRANDLDFYDISVVDGFNVPIELSPTSYSRRQAIRCVADINGQCPTQLRAPDGGCNNPCTVYPTNQYCCTNGTCGPTDFSRFFKERCPDAYSYPQDDDTSLFTGPAGTNYSVMFCP